MTAEEVLTYVKEQTEDQLLQVGGDATTGRGHVMIRGFGWNGKEE
jgi:CRISPR/Cas system CMR subunit Cmr4 (Cas7 group RAMP superfamily)